jgi:hypothetical protein
VEAHIHDACIAGAVDTRRQFVETQNGRQIASGIDTWTFRLEQGRYVKQRVGVDIAFEPVEDTSGLGIDRISTAATLDIAV